MPTIHERDRVYQTSDLAGASRKDFISAGLRGVALLRTPEGESLALTRAANIDLLASLRDYLASYIRLNEALNSGSNTRRPVDFGDWAFLAVFDDDALAEFQGEINDALMLALSSGSDDSVENVLADWKRSARALGDPVTRALIMGEHVEDDFVEVHAPEMVDADA